MKLLKNKDLKKNEKVLCIVTDTQSIIDFLKSIDTQSQLNDFVCEFGIAEKVPIVKKLDKNKHAWRYISERGFSYKAAFPVDPFKE